MQTYRSRKISDSGHSPWRLLLSIGVPVLLVSAFLGKQLIGFDNIGWHNGFNHPLTGWDHLVTMLAVGIWAAQLRGQAIWMLPLAFVGVMSLGGLAGAAGFSIPSLEGIILLSCAVFSVLISRRIRFSSQVNVLIVSFFAFFHGFAHGQEISTSASLISYTLGFMLATLLLHGAGILVAKLIVFAITCLLTIIFSHAALAKSAEAFPSAEPANGWLSQESDSLRNVAPTFITGDPGGYLVRQISDGGATAARSDDAKLELKKEHQIQPAAPALPAAAAFFPVPAAVWQAALLPLKGFKGLFPAINHSPGTTLLSNGVGLTSPPQAFPVSRNFLSLRPHSPIEAFPLQSTVAEVLSGKTDTLAEFRLACMAQPSSHDLPLAPPFHSPALIRLNAAQAASKLRLPAENPPLNIKPQAKPVWLFAYNNNNPSDIDL